MCCRLADASSGASVELGRLEREHVIRYMGYGLFISLLIGIDIFALHNEKTSWNIDHDVNMYTDGSLK